MYQSFNSSHITLDKYIMYVEQTVANSAPQRKKEIERYGEREKLSFCWFTHYLVASPPEEPPSRLTPLTVSLSHPSLYHCLSFFLCSFIWTHKVQIGPIIQNKRERKIVGGETALSNKTQIKRSSTLLTDDWFPRRGLGLCETGLLFFLSLKSMLLKSPSS